MRLAGPYEIIWPDNRWRPGIFKRVSPTQSVGLWCGTNAVRRRCWREVRREIHLKRFGYYPRTEKWERF